MKPRLVIAALLGLMLLEAVLSPKPKAPPPNTPETDAMKLVAGSITQFETTHERTPRDWEELTAGSEPKFSIDFVTPQSKPSIRYELFSPPLEMEDAAHQKVQVVAATRQPMREALRDYGCLYTRTTDPGRYLIFKASGPGFQAGWFPETAVEAMWSAAGKNLPTPDQEPARTWWRAQRWPDFRVYAFLAVYAAGFWMILRWKSRMWERMSEV